MGVSTALLVIDVLNRYDHPDAEPLAASAETATPNIARLLEDAHDRDVLTVYVNDNHGDWTLGRSALADWAREGERPDLIDPIAPAHGMPFLLKARHSAFYETQLSHMLREREVDRVVLTGQVTEQCILYSALDAHVRGLDVVVPQDAVAYIHKDLADAALRMIERNMRGTVCPAAEVFAGAPAQATSANSS